MRFAREIFMGAAIAHRGLFNNHVPENSLEAIELALQKGFGVEFDVRLSADNQVIVFHDDDLLRLCGLDRLVEKEDATFLTSCKLGNSNCAVPLLSSVLKMFENQTMPSQKQLVVVELKSFSKTQGFDNNRFALENATIELLQSRQPLPFPVVLKSFNPNTVEYLLNRNLPWPVGLISCRHENDDDFSFLQGTTQSDRQNANLRETALELQNLTHPVASKCDFISYSIDDLTTALVQQVRKNEQGLLSWTVRQQHQKTKAQTLVDNYIFEEKNC